MATATSSATVWQKLTHNHLTTTGNSFGAQLFHVYDTAVFSNPASTWTTQALATTATNEISGASLTSNQITLPAGTYHVRAMTYGRTTATGFTSLTTSYMQARLRNITGSTNLLYSGTATVTAGTNSGSVAAIIGSSPPLHIEGRIVLAGSTVLELQTWATQGYISTDAAISGGQNIFSQVYIWKVA